MATKLQFKLEIFFYYLKKNLYLLIGAILLGVLLFSQWSLLVKTYFRLFYNTEVIGVEGFYTDNNLPDFVAQDISFGLTKVLENGKTTNSPIISHMSIENENMDYIFTLKDNIYWHTGKKVQPTDLDFHINGITTTALDANKVKISANNAFAPLLVSLGKPIIKKNFVGMGPYKVNKVEYQDGFLKKLALTSLDPHQKNKTYLFFPSEKDVINAYKLGEIDTSLDISAQYDFATWPKTQITPHVQTNQKYIGIFFNTNKIGNKQTRQALAYDTPKTNDKNERCLGPISPESWAYNNSVKEYNYNATRAKELFDNNKIDKINLTVIDRRLLNMAENIKNTWHQDLGIDVTLSTENQLHPDSYEAVITYASIPTDPDQYVFWHSTQTDLGNITHLSNSRIDKLLEEGRQTFDPLERKRIYMDFQRYLLEESPAVFISYPTTYTIERIP